MSWAVRASKVTYNPMVVLEKIPVFWQWYGVVLCINSIIPVLLFMFVINSNRRCGDPTEFYDNKIQETQVHTLTLHTEPQQETNSGW